MDQFEHAAQAARSEAPIDSDWLLVDSSDGVDRSLMLWFGNWESSRFSAEALKMVRAQASLLRTKCSSPANPLSGSCASCALCVLRLLGC